MNARKRKISNITLRIKEEFNYDKNLKKSQCKHCLMAVSGTNTGNLRTHLKKHRGVFQHKVALTTVSKEEEENRLDPANAKKKICIVISESAFFNMNL
jgi:hypothetical protein